ncbi:hypothetical protein [Aneurinibacillus terranovensis]|nr:hypothetical protein [Aneurinibacillus terranovensis]
MKKKDLIIRYVPNRVDYSDKEMLEAQSKKEMIIDYILKNVLYQGAASK